MDDKEMEKLLHDWARRNPPQRLFSDQDADALKARLARTAQPDVLAQRADDDATGDSDTFLRPGSRSTTARRLLYFGGAAVAAALLVAGLAIQPRPAAVRTATPTPTGLPAPNPRDPKQQPEPARSPRLLAAVHGAYDRASLSAGPVVRSAPPAAAAPSEFFIRIRLAAPAFIRLVAIDASGASFPLALNRAGDETMHLAAEEPYIFGGYDLLTGASSDPSTLPAAPMSRHAGVRTFAVMATDQKTEHSAFTEILSRLNDPQNRTAIASADPAILRAALARLIPNTDIHLVPVPPPAAP